MTQPLLDTMISAGVVLVPFSVVLLIVKVCHLLLTRRPFFSRTPGGALRGVELMALGVSTALPVWTVGLFIGFSPDGAGAACSQAAGRPLGGQGPHSSVRLVERTFPLSRTCVWDDGTRLELVPLWVNVLLGLATAAVLVGAALVVRRALRGTARQPAGQDSKRAAAT